MSIDIYVQDANGNSLGHMEVDTDQVIALPPRCTVKDYGATLVVRLGLDDGVDFLPDPLDVAEAEERDARVGSLEDRGFPYAGGYGEGQ